MLEPERERGEGFGAEELIVLIIVVSSVSRKVRGKGRGWRTK
jgi:hypothetical protein